MMPIMDPLFIFEIQDLKCCSITPDPVLSLIQSYTVFELLGYVSYYVPFRSLSSRISFLVSASSIFSIPKLKIQKLRLGPL